MRASILMPALLAVGAIGAPASLERRVMETEVVIMTTTTTTTLYPAEETGVPGGDGINKGVGSWTWSWSSSSEVTSTAAAAPPAGPPVSAPVDSPAPSPTPSDTPSPSPEPSSTPSPASSSASSPAASPRPSGGSSGNSPTSGGVPMIDTINKWRSAMGRPALTWDTTLEANAQKCANDNAQAGTMNHEVFPPSTAQNLGPGFQEVPQGTVQYATGISANGQSWQQAMQGMTPFELTYVAWLCEKPDAPGLSGTVDYCGVDTNILNSHNKEPGTGHYDNLVGDFTKIACAFAADPSPDPTWPQYAGMWDCDLA